MNPDPSSFFVTGGHDGTIKFWSAGDQQELVSFQRHRGLVSDLAFTRSGEMLCQHGRTDGTAVESAARMTPGGRTRDAAF